MRAFFTIYLCLATLGLDLILTNDTSVFVPEPIIVFTFVYTRVCDITTF